MTTTVEQELRECISQLNEAELQSVLQLIKTFLLGRQQTTDATSIEDYNKELNEAEAEFERGKFITHEEMLKQIKKNASVLNNTIRRLMTHWLILKKAKLICMKKW